MDFEILIAGTDANAYYMARCYHELTGRRARLLGKAPLPFTAFSDILTVHYDERIWDEKGFLEAAERMQLKGKKVLLVSSNETYAGFISGNSDALKKMNYVFNYPDKSVIDTLMYKESFYKTYSDSVLSLPKTEYYSCEIGGEIPEWNKFPMIVKPSNVIEYNHISFDGKNKIYKITSREELKKTIDMITAAGYRDQLILQDYIPGDDSRLFDAVAYCDKNGKLKMLSFAQIGLQEHTRTMVGNAAVLINGRNPFGGTEETADKIKSFLEGICYRGFAEFDLKYDERDDSFKVLEINARQGRSSYYICKLGCNPVELLAKDCLFGGVPEYGLLKSKALLSFVPKGIIKKYVKSPDFKAEALRLWKKGHTDPLHYNRDGNFKRRIYLLKRTLRYYRDYANGYWRNE